MNESHTKYLLETYKFFKYDEWVDDPNAMQNTAMVFGFQHNDGWYELVNTLCVVIQNIIDNAKLNNTEYVDNLAVSTVKEKYGTLHFYHDGEWGGEIEGAVHMAETMSCRICEHCGHPGRLRGVNWFSTECDKCWETHGKP